jgi:hypothetical protein
MKILYQIRLIKRENEKQWKHLTAVTSKLYFNF